MSSKKQVFSGRYVIKLVRRRTSMLLIAFMLGMSNVVLEEDRMVNDTRAHIEQQGITDEDDLHDVLATLKFFERFHGF